MFLQYVRWYLLVCLVVPLASAATTFNVGRGIADCTGVIAEATMYGYGDVAHDARGIHLRQFSRAYVIEEIATSERLVYVIPEVPMISEAVHLGVMEKLEELYGGLYHHGNVMLAPTHTHSGPGGFHTYWMYVMPTRGIVNETMNAYVDGIVKSIQRAHDDLQPGNIFIGDGQLEDASINRSPVAYDNNPEEERNKYSSNKDNTMTVLKFVSENGEDLGLISFFAVHTTSMPNDNHLVSTDNKGYASLAYEQEMNPGTFPGQGKFLAAFAQTAMGDVSPNILGEFCDVTLEPCDYLTSTCPEKPKDPRLCNGYGPKMEMFEDTKLTGEKQFLKAKIIYEAATEELIGPLGHVFQWINITGRALNVDGSTVHTCKPAMGYSFAAGCSDGPGIPPFTQADTKGSFFIDYIVGNFLNLPVSREVKQCQSPKPVLLNSGEASWPDEGDWPWQPEILPMQMFRIGNFIISGVPAEFCTMSGRRLGDAVKKVAMENGVSDTVRSIVTSMANTYSSYVTTFEEYQLQRYEGASTPYGPYTLDAYLDIYATLTESLLTNSTIELGTPPPDLRALPREGVPDIRIDEVPMQMTYGDVVFDVFPSYKQGRTATVKFVSGNPRLNLRTGSTFLEVQQLVNETWVTIATDANWETRFYWESECHDSFEPLKCRDSQASEARIEWAIPDSQESGTYRIIHYGTAMPDSRVPVDYTGTSSSFDVISST